MLLSLITAVMFGTGDFIGGLAGKRMRVLQALAGAHLIGLVGVTATSLLIADRFRWEDLGFGAIAGAFGFVGLALLYRGLARGPMGVVAPLTAITSAAVPAFWGTVVDDDSLSLLSWLGVSFALLAIGLVSRADDDGGSARVTARVVGEALLAGAGFGFMFVVLAQTDPTSAPWPIVGARLLTASVLLAAFTITGRQVFPRDRVSFQLVVGLGLFDTGSNVVFLYAADRGSLTVVAVLSSLYPIATVLLARFVLGEQMSRIQTGAFVMAMAATGFIVAG